MKVFVSSTFADLVPEREAVMAALRRRQECVLAMEDFLATPTTPLETALRHLRESDVMILVIGFKAGSLLPSNSEMTYTSAEYSEALKLGRHVLVFLKQAKKSPKSRREEWLNKERSHTKANSLARFRADVGSRWTWQTFSTPDTLALAAIQSLDKWESQGRPGARKTFSGAAEYFASKIPQSKTPILDFTTSLFGREQEIELLDSFLSNDSQSVCVIGGRGGIGKSKLLHDWTQRIRDRQIVFLKDEPTWHTDSAKEVPTGSVVLIVDDAHHSGSMAHVIDLLKEFRRRQPMKLVLSTRPGGHTMLTHTLSRDLDQSEVAILPELQELSKEQALLLAREVLGEGFAVYAEPLADIAGNTPLVIVAGGRLIASEHISPVDLTNLGHFRSTIFNRFLGELRLEGPSFAISPTRPLLNLIAALGPVDADSEAFLAAAEKFLLRPRDEILSTLDALGATGIVTRRGSPVRILPDVLSDFVLEDRCVGEPKRTTHYADRVYAYFAGDFFQSLMRNLSELDWRLGRSGYGLDLLSGIWNQVERNFLNGDEYARHRILNELGPAAVYQPDHILRLINLALHHPIPRDESASNRYKGGKAYVIAAIPRLLEATAHHPTHLEESVDLLWELSKQEPGRNSDSGSAQGVLKRLASYDRYVWPYFNFALLVQSIRLTQLPDAFERQFTPIALVNVLLEREGEFTEYADDIVSFGGFGLNMAAVGLLRQNVLDFLEFALSSDREMLAVNAAESLGSLLHAYLNRVGREPSESEVAWQNAERLRALDILWRRSQQPASVAVRTQVYDAIRSGISVNCPDPVRDAASAALPKLVRDSDLAIFDGLCTGETDLPILSKEFDADSWGRQLQQLTLEAHDLLAEIPTPAERAVSLLADVKNAMALRIEPRGFQRIVQSFAADVEFLCVLADQLLADEQVDKMTTQLSMVLDALHSNARGEFHARAQMILEDGDPGKVRAAAGALRVYGDNATVEDVSQIKAFLTYPDHWVKSLALQAIAYMGRNVHLPAELLDAALSTRVEGDAHVAMNLADAFGAYGVPLSLLDPSNVSELLGQFLRVQDFDANQGSLPRFLNQLVVLFPNNVLAFLQARVAMEHEEQKRKNWDYRALNHVYESVSFGALEAADRLRLAQSCLDAYLASDEESEGHAKLFWMVAGADDSPLALLVTALDGSPRRTKRIASLIRDSSKRLAFTHPDFARAILGKLSGSNPEEVVDAFVRDAHTLPGGAYAGEPNDYWAQHRARIKNQVDAFPDDGDLAALAAALKRSIVP